MQGPRHGCRSAESGRLEPAIVAVGGRPGRSKGGSGPAAVVLTVYTGTGNPPRRAAGSRAERPRGLNLVASVCWGRRVAERWGRGWVRPGAGRGARRDPERANHERGVAATREAPGDRAFAAVWSAGRALSRDGATAEALSAAGGAPGAAGVESDLPPGAIIRSIRTPPGIDVRPRRHRQLLPACAGHGTRRDHPATIRERQDRVERRDPVAGIGSVGSADAQFIRRLPVPSFHLLVTPALQLVGDALSSSLDLLLGPRLEPDPTVAAIGGAVVVIADPDRLRDAVGEGGAGPTASVVPALPTRSLERPAPIVVDDREPVLTGVRDGTQSPSVPPLVEPPHR